MRSVDRGLHITLQALVNSPLTLLVYLCLRQGTPSSPLPHAPEPSMLLRPRNHCLTILRPRPAGGPTCTLKSLYKFARPFPDTLYSSGPSASARHIHCFHSLRKKSGRVTKTRPCSARPISRAAQASFSPPCAVSAGTSRTPYAYAHASYTKPRSPAPRPS